MSSRNWVTTTCKFCKQVLDEAYIPTCDCQQWQEAEAENRTQVDGSTHNDIPIAGSKYASIWIYQGV